MFSVVTATLFITGFLIISILDTSLLAGHLYIAAVELYLLIMMFRPVVVRHRELAEYTNNFLRWIDQSKVLKKCEGCIHIREPFGTCEIYWVPTQAWASGRMRVCNDYEKGTVVRDIDDLDSIHGSFVNPTNTHIDYEPESVLDVKWYHSYNDPTILVGAICCVLLGAFLMSKSLVIIGIPFVLVGIGVVFLFTISKLNNPLRKRKVVQYECPNCGAVRRVLNTTVRYVCEECKSLVVVRKVAETGVSLPFAKVVGDFRKARYLESKGRLDEALELYLSNIRNCEGVSLVHYERAAAILEQQGRIAEAVVLLEQAMKTEFPLEVRDYRDHEVPIILKKLRAKLAMSNG